MYGVGPPARPSAGPRATPARKAAERNSLPSQHASLTRLKHNLLCNDGFYGAGVVMRLRLLN